MSGPHVSDDCCVTLVPVRYTESTRRISQSDLGFCSVPAGLDRKGTWHLGADIWTLGQARKMDFDPVE
jgi:hypothetical protein